MREFKQKIPKKFVISYELDNTQKTTCPQCRKNKKFTPYVNIVTTTPIDASLYGWCDRATSCGYKKKPTPEALKGQAIEVPLDKVHERFRQKEYINTHCLKLVERSMVFQDNFSQFLLSNFDPEIVKHVLTKYKVGTSTMWGKSTIFWQIDRDFEVRAGKVVAYNKETGGRRRDKNSDGSDRITNTWIHDIQRKRGSAGDFNLCQCLFGEHLIRDYQKICIVESEKTVIVCMIWRAMNGMPDDTLFVAVGGIYNLKSEKFEGFKEKQFTFLPDSGDVTDYLNGKKRRIAVAKLWSEKITPMIEDGFECKLRAFENCTDTPEKFKSGSDAADIIYDKLGILK